MLIAAYSIFLANFLFGALVKSRIIDSRSFRIVHHLLYLLVVVSLLVATLLAFMRGRHQAWGTGAMAGLLLCMPLFRGRSRGHWIFAILCALLYTLLVIWSESEADAPLP